MDHVEIRDLDEVRVLLVQSLCLQRAQEPEVRTVRPALDWALELLSNGNPLPPVGFIADVGHIALGAESEDRTGRAKQTPVGVPPQLLPTYEDHVLGKIYADWMFSSAAEALRGYPAGRDRARGLAFILEQFRRRAGCFGLIFSPGVIKGLLNEPPEHVLQLGLAALHRDGLHPLLSRQYEALISTTRRLAEVLGKEDLLELQTRSALEEESDRLAFRQVAQAATLLERTLPRHRVRPLPRRQEVPTRVLDEDTYPVGGFSSLSNRGSVESLLHSQLAYIDEQEQPDLFDIKYLRDELLFYSRDENQFLRRRRTFVFAFYPDLIERIHFKDAETPFQRGVLLLALLYLVVQKLSEWLSTDALLFEFVFVIPEQSAWRFELRTEFELLARLFREQVAAGGVSFTFYLLPAGRKDQARQGELEELKRQVREQLPDGGGVFRTATGEEAVQELCLERARRSLCHCLALSVRPRELEALDVVFTRLQLDGAAPALAGMHETPVIPEGNDVMEQWGAALRQILGRWV